MPQATQTGILDSIFARFQKRKGTKPAAKPNINEIDPATGKPKVQSQQQSQEEESPDVMSMYDGLFSPADPETLRKNEPPKFLLAADKVKEAAGKMDFTSGLPDDIVQKLQSGEAIDGKTLLAAINFAGRQAYSRALEHSTGLTSHFIEARVKHEQQGLPAALRTHLAKSKAISGPNASDNPVVREHMSMISEKIAGKFPDATEDEVATLTQEYFTEMAKAINPKAFQQQTGQSETRQRGKDEVVVEDWSAYLQPTEEQQQNSQQQQQSNESKAA
jgi:hypothetical protein